VLSCAWVLRRSARSRHVATTTIAHDREIVVYGAQRVASRNQSLTDTRA
jgi:hypothetical protein